MDDNWRAWRTRRKAKPREVESTAQALYAALVKETLSPALRAAGFTGSGGRYELRHEAKWALLGFQKSTYSDALEVQFTVNLLVVDKQAWAQRVVERPYYPARPAPGTLYGESAAQTRIGALTPDGEDKWWRVTDSALVPAVAADCVHDIESYGLPWMRQQLERP